MFADDEVGVIVASELSLEQVGVRALAMQVQLPRSIHNTAFVAMNNDDEFQSFIMAYRKFSLNFELADSVLRWSCKPRVRRSSSDDNIVARNLS